MTRLLPLLAAALLAVPATAQDAPALSLEQTMLVRCSAAFAIVANEQQRGAPGVNKYPPLEVRGKEFFVRSSARLMDELQLSREALQALMFAEVESLQTQSMESDDPAAYVDSVMRPCLAALDTTGL